MAEPVLNNHRISRSATVQQWYDKFGPIFQRGMERFATVQGMWWYTAFWVTLNVLWILTGPFAHWSNTWQLIANTITTIVGLYMGLSILVASNRMTKLQMDYSVRQTETLNELRDLTRELHRVEQEELAQLDTIAADLSEDHM